MFHFYCKPFANSWMNLWKAGQNVPEIDPLVSDSLLVMSAFFERCSTNALLFPTPCPSTLGTPGVENRPLQNLEDRPIEPMKKRIMVLDDDEQIRQSLLKLLQKEDYEVVLAAEGIEALDKLERQ